LFLVVASSTKIKTDWNRDTLQSYQEKLHPMKKTFLKK